MMNGATTNPANAFGTHHTRIVGNKASHGTIPPQARLTALKAALTVVPTKHAQPMYPVASRVRSIALSKPTNLFNRKTQTMAPMVLPMAVPRVKKPSGIPFMNAKRIAPTATPGQKR
jgi:hypothetical protein